MKNIFKIYQSIKKQNKKNYYLNSKGLVLFLFSKLSYPISTLLILLNINPNNLSYFNFVISIFIFFIILMGDNLYLGIILFFLITLLDFSDGTLARYYKITSFYGKFIDGLIDIFKKSFLILSISFYSFKILQDFNLLIIGCIASIFTSFESFVLDRYSAIVRWYNQEFNKNIKPYSRKTFLPIITFFLGDFYMILLFSLPFVENNNKLFYLVLLTLFITLIFSALMNIIIYTFLSYKNLNSKKDNK